MVRPQNEMVGYFNITASLDYDCIVVAGNVHVCKVVILAWDQSILSLPVSPRNESIPQSVPRFTVGQFDKGPTSLCTKLYETNFLILNHTEKYTDKLGHGTLLYYLLY